MQETLGQYLGIGSYGLRCNANIFYIDLSCFKEIQSFVILFTADIPFTPFFYIALSVPFYISYFRKQPLKIIP